MKTFSEMEIGMGIGIGPSPLPIIPLVPTSLSYTHLPACGLNGGGRCRACMAMPCQYCQLCSASLLAADLSPRSLRNSCRALQVILVQSLPYQSHPAIPIVSNFFRRHWPLALPHQGWRNSSVDSADCHAIGLWWSRVRMPTWAKIILNVFFHLHNPRVSGSI